ncbi:MAG TPA: MaoC family dehydratase N-terminal domain-containing protein [Ramlibacter sp.]|uniref:FAS1-like dehydratase domain-containing protein n=1 Tax=Ramlibacter sp. TaxID=1917967 RepID=UPI002BF1FCA0|nr:MaoC family dehydratase N-terminal domain-containing protein [Ramlibacter sp.]HVZ43587.1 MaoC family dehydratase N-terminal domain-containing protein [Ramlibacter sp.]
MSGNAQPDVAAIEASLRAMHGPIGEPDTMPVESMAVRRMALCVEDFDAIHYDEAAAKARGYRGIVAPWPLLWLVFFNCRTSPLKFDFGRATLHGGDAYEFHEPMIVGDTITMTAAVSETSVKQGKSGLMGFVTSRREFRNQFGQLCAVMSTTNIRR